MVLRKNFPHIIIIRREIAGDDCNVAISQPIFPYQLRNRLRCKVYFRDRCLGDMHRQLLKRSTKRLSLASEQILLQVPERPVFPEARQLRLSKHDRLLHLPGSRAASSGLLCRTAHALYQPASRCKQLMLVNRTECRLLRIDRYCQKHLLTLDEQLLDHLDLRGRKSCKAIQGKHGLRQLF